MPENAGGDRAPRDPGIGQVRELFSVGKTTDLFDLLCGFGQCQIALRPNIGSEQRHQKVDVCGPRTDAGKLQQDGPDGLITQLGHGREVERAGPKGAGDRVTVGRLLSGEAGCAESGFGGGRDMARRHSIDDALEPGIRGLG